MIEDRLGGIWFGTFGEGVYRFDPRTGEYRHYPAKQNTPGALKTATLGCIVEDTAGMLWVGTHSGLHHYDRERDCFVHHPMTGHEEQQGHFIRGMVLDGAGSLWIGAGGYLSRFDLSRQTFRDFSAGDGVDIPQTASLVRDSTGHRIFAGSLQGKLAAYDPSELPAAGSSSMPKVALTDFRVFEKSVPLEAPLHKLTEITLTHEQNYFSFTYSALVFLGIEKIGYAHTMEDFDRDWIETGSRAYAGYTNLDPGDYVFRVKSTNIEGVWSTESTSIRIRILPPWWRSAWAYLAYTLLLGSTLFALWRYDRNRVRLRHELQMKEFETSKLLEIDQIKTRFFANISHEFRTPLTLILGPVEKLQEKLGGTAHAADLTMVRRNALRLLRLVNQILDLSRLDAGGMSLQASPTNVVAFLKPLVHSFTSMADRKRQTLLFDPEEEAIIVYADRDKLEKAVTNLISNALKFTPEGGEIVVSVRVRTADGKPVDTKSPASPRFLEIAVSDTGIGISADKQEKVFDRFYRVDDSRPHERGGTGIGLALTRELVMLHRGEVLLRSAPGQGSTFTIRLPMGTSHLRQEEIVEHAVTPEGRITPVEIDIEASEAASRADSPAAEETDAQVRPRVLIVEDSPDVRTYVRGFLEHEYTVDEAGDGKEGLEKAAVTMPDLVITDIMMPVMEGIEMCRMLKTDDRTSHIPVIMLTARAGESSKLEGLETGADDYLIKPFDARELRVRARNLVDLRKKLREKYRQHVVLEPASVPIASTDERFLKKLMETIESRIADPELDTEKLAREACMSRMQLNRKLQALTGHSTHEFLRLQRLQKAARLLAARSGNVTEVAYDVGFNSLSHFAKAFREEFGVSPSEYSAQQRPGAESHRAGEPEGTK
jgi:signal transduction histidine kinase/DNA-binding response OmpR family regulator